MPTEEYLASADPPSGQIASVRLPALAQQWPGPLIDGFVTLSRADSASQGLAPAELQLPESGGRIRNGAYVGQWWLFAGIHFVHGISDGTRYRRTGGGGG